MDDEVDDARSRSSRGGAFNSGPLYVRPANRAGGLPAGRYEVNGFRPARTVR